MCISDIVLLSLNLWYEWYIVVIEVAVLGKNWRTFGDLSGEVLYNLQKSKG